MMLHKVVLVSLLALSAHGDEDGNQSPPPSCGPVATKAEWCTMYQDQAKGCVLNNQHGLDHDADDIGATCDGILSPPVDPNAPCANDDYVCRGKKMGGDAVDAVVGFGKQAGSAIAGVVSDPMATVNKVDGLLEEGADYVEGSCSKGLHAAGLADAEDACSGNNYAHNGIKYALVPAVAIGVVYGGYKVCRYLLQKCGFCKAKKPTVVVPGPAGPTPSGPSQDPSDPTDPTNVTPATGSSDEDKKEPVLFFFTYVEGEEFLGFKGLKQNIGILIIVSIALTFLLLCAACCACCCGDSGYDDEDRVVRVSHRLRQDV